MDSLDQLKSHVDIFDLADRLGLTRPMKKGNYNSPHHDDKSPSLHLFNAKSGGGQGFKDYSSEGVANAKGSVIDLVMYVRNCDLAEAISYLKKEYGLEDPKPAFDDSPKKESLAEFIARQSLVNPEPVIAYLKTRGISEDVCREAIRFRALGFNAYASKKIEAGQLGHGGAAAVFITRDLISSKVVAVDMRYLDPDLNGGLKTQCQGEKLGHPWCVSQKKVKDAQTVYLVESPINALSIESCGLPFTTAVAVRGLNVEGIDWTFLRGKQVILAFDEDIPDIKNNGRRPGAEAAWLLYELLTDLNIACLLVDSAEWTENGWNDVNDILQEKGPSDLRIYLRRWETNVIPGLPIVFREGYKSRVYLPSHDCSQYWRYRVKPDFTQFVTESKEDDNGVKTEKIDDLATFRVADVSRVMVSSSASTITGDEDQQSQSLMVIRYQVARHGPQMHHMVVTDEGLHNMETWKKIGTVFKPQQFLRLVNIFERTALKRSKVVSNYVGLCWLQGKLIVNEGPDTFFSEPEKQCPYHKLTFKSGTVDDARQVIHDYQATFKDNAALMLLVWGLSGHLKALLGFWPHMFLQASKGSGKSVLCKRLERSIGFTMFSGQSLQTEFRVLTSLCGTSHPVGWEELSARGQNVIDKAVSILQEAYNYSPTRRGRDLIELLVSAPVLLAGEDIPARSLLGKSVRTDISDRKGPRIPDESPQFPMRNWLQFLAKQKPAEVRERYGMAQQWCRENTHSDLGDSGAERIVENYAGVMLGWSLLCEFAEIDKSSYGFPDSLLREMNRHLSETAAEREPWVWIVDIVLSEMAANRFQHPYIVDWDDVDPEKEPALCLFIRPGHMMDHIAHSPALREKWNGLPIKSANALTRQLKSSGLVVRERVDRSIGHRKVHHLMALSVDRLGDFGLSVSEPAA